MAPEVRWQASSAATLSGNDDALGSDQESVEILLQRLIKRIEESERRYAEAIDELHARLGHISQAADTNEMIGTPEEAETLERLRQQLSDLARRLEQPEPHRRAEPLPRLDKALSEVQAVSVGLANPEPNWFASLSKPVEPEFSSGAWLPNEPPQPSPSVADDDADFDRRLIEMAQRLERSIGEAMPSSAIESLNDRMDDISARFEAALAETPKLETLHHIELQVADMGQQLGRVEQQAARIGAVEGQLQRLIDRLEQTPVELERAASKVAQETVRLVSETGFGKSSPAERLDALHRDITTMNERNLAVDDRLVDTLVAMHESIKGLAQQRDRERAMVPSSREARSMPQTVSKPDTEDYARPEQPPVARIESEPTTHTSDTLSPLARVTRGVTIEEAGGREAIEASRPRTAFIRDIPFDSTEDLAAAARRAAEAAAARVDGRNPAPPREGSPGTRSGEQPSQHKFPILMLVAAVLLIISAALLFTRLKLKPDLDVPPPAAEEIMPPPAAEAPPLPGTPYQSEVVPPPGDNTASPAEATPGAPSESEMPKTLPDSTHAIPKSPIGMEDSRSRLGAGDDEAEIQPVSLGPAGGRGLPPGVGVMVVEP